jgi:hypothetical protein
LRVGGILSILVLALVPQQSFGYGGTLARCRLLDIHGHDFHLLWNLLWQCGIHVKPLVYTHHLWCRQGGLII